jgi:hypothetical protein
MTIDDVVLTPIERKLFEEGLKERWDNIDEFIRHQIHLQYAKFVILYEQKYGGLPQMVFFRRRRDISLEELAEEEIRTHNGNHCPYDIKCGDSDYGSEDACRTAWYNCGLFRMFRRDDARGPRRYIPQHFYEYTHYHVF